MILLRKAINYSLQADTFYQASMQNNSATDATVLHRDTDVNWVLRDPSIHSRAAAKDAFLNAYLPWAARLGFPSTGRGATFRPASIDEHLAWARS